MSSSFLLNVDGQQTVLTNFQMSVELAQIKERERERDRQRKRGNAFEWNIVLVRNAMCETHDIPRVYKLLLIYIR